MSDPDICVVTLMTWSCYRVVMHLSVLLIALERYITILKPLTHCYILTDKRIRYSIVATWLTGFCYVLGMYIHRCMYDAPERIVACGIELYEIWKIIISQMIVSILAFIAAIVMYTHLHFIGRKHLRVIEAERRMFGLVHYQRNLRRSKVAFLISLQIILIEVPVYILGMASLVRNEQVYAKGSFLLISVSQLFQPAFYALFSTEFRKALKKLVRRSAVRPSNGDFGAAFGGPRNGPRRGHLAERF